MAAAKSVPRSTRNSAVLSTALAVANARKGARCGTTRATGRRGGLGDAVVLDGLAGSTPGLPRRLGEPLAADTLKSGLETRAVESAAIPRVKAERPSRSARRGEDGAETSRDERSGGVWVSRDRGGGAGM